MPGRQREPHQPRRLLLARAARRPAAAGRPGRGSPRARCPGRASVRSTARHQTGPQLPSAPALPSVAGSASSADRALCTASRWPPHLRARRPRRAPAQAGGRPTQIRSASPAATSASAAVSVPRTSPYRRERTRAGRAWARWPTSASSAARSASARITTGSASGSSASRQRSASAVTSARAGRADGVGLGLGGGGGEHGRAPHPGLGDPHRQLRLPAQPPGLPERARAARATRRARPSRCRAAAAGAAAGCARRRSPCAGRAPTPAPAPPA